MRLRNSEKSYAFCQAPGFGDQRKALPVRSDVRKVTRDMSFRILQPECTKTRRTQQFEFILGVILLIRLAGVGGGTFSPPASAQGHGYSQRVRELLDYGYTATQAQQWKLAIGYYGDAQKELPHDPAILLSLGLANAK